jgi:CheY-like chemotaxis protein
MAVLLAEGDLRRVRDFLADTPVRVIFLDPLGDWRQQILKERPTVLMLDPEPVEGPCRLLLSALFQGQFPEVKSVIVLMRLTEVCNEDPLPCGRIQLLSRSYDQATLKASLNYSTSSDLKTVSSQRKVCYPEIDGSLILLAEDNELNARIVKDWFEAAGYQLVIAENGVLAIELITELMPALVIMDGQMPGLDGFQVTQKLRDNELTKSIPIIALTALAMPGDREKWLAVGVEEYLSKPVSMHQLQFAVENTLMARRTVSAVEGQANETLFLDGTQTPADQAERERLAVP